MKRESENAHQNELTQAYRYRLHDKGLCIRCRQPLGVDRADRLLCRACADDDRMAHRERYYRLKNAGLCVSCGKLPRATGKTLCKPCLFDRAAKQAMYRTKKEIAKWIKSSSKD